MYNVYYFSGSDAVLFTVQSGLLTGMTGI